ncbi:MAG TPA: hypothetical protein PKO09_02710 [Anaerolineae bacterium]|nr:hypothetical protein [Anaerolineae bacterium]
MCEPISGQPSGPSYRRGSTYPSRSIFTARGTDSIVCTPLRPPSGVPVYDGSSEEYHDNGNCPRPAPGQQTVTTGHLKRLDCVLCEYTGKPQVQGGSDAGPRS